MSLPKSLRADMAVCRGSRPCATPSNASPASALILQRVPGLCSASPACAHGTARAGPRLRHRPHVSNLADGARLSADVRRLMPPPRRRDSRDSVERASRPQLDAARRASSPRAAPTNMATGESRAARLDYINMPEQRVSRNSLCNPRHLPSDHERRVLSIQPVARRRRRRSI